MIERHQFRVHRLRLFQFIRLGRIIPDLIRLLVCIIMVAQVIGAGIVHRLGL